MIYQLMKRDPAWRMAPYLVIASAVLWPLHSSDLSEVASVILSSIYMMCIMFFRVNERCTLFTAALPIAGRQIYLARILSWAAFIWLPILAAVTVSWRDTVVLIETGALASVAVLLIQSVRVREISAPPWFTLVSASVLAMTVIVQVFFVSARVVLTSCASVGAILFLKAWAGVPKSFQVAPIKATSQRLEAPRLALPVAAWWPAFRALFTWQFFALVPALFLFPMHQGAILATIWVAMTLQQSHPGLHWLLSLPVSRRKLLLAVLLPPLVLLMAGYTIGIHFEQAPQTIQMRIIGVAAILVIAHGQVFLMHLQFWRPLLAFPPRVLRIVSVLFIFPIFLVYLVDSLWQPKGSLTAAALARIAGILPDNLTILTTLAVASVGAVYWAIDKQFRELEVAEWRQQAKYV
jgi:hypothetical protein